LRETEGYYDKHKTHRIFGKAHEKYKRILGKILT
jgi:hypothetical protein